MPLWQLGASERALLQLTSPSLYLGAQPMIWDPLDSKQGCSPTISRLTHPCSAGLERCKPFHLICDPKATDPKPSGILRADTKPAGILRSSAPSFFSSPAGIPAALEDLSPPRHSTPSPPAVFPFTFPTAPAFHPLIGNFPCCPASREIHSDL